MFCVCEHRDERGTLQVGDLSFKVETTRDHDAGPPWENQDTLGHVSNWEMHDKRPGEKILNEERRGAKRFYDFAGAVAQARKEGFNGPDAVEAVEREFLWMKSWCQDGWVYVGVIVTLLDVDGNETEEFDSIWGVEDEGDFVNVQAHELANSLHTRVAHLDELVNVRRQRIRKAA